MHTRAKRNFVAGDRARRKSSASGTLYCRIFYPVAVFRYLFCTVDSVAGVAETRKDISVLIETLVLGTDVNVYVRVRVG